MRDVLRFTKMHGIGNDYIYINCFEYEITDPEELAIRLSDRHFGIGSDGLVLICPSDTADAKMRMFNIDGSEGKMCGNAIRCVGKYLYDNGIRVKDHLTIETLSGIKTLDLHVKDGKVDSVSVDMGKAVLTPRDIPVVSDLESVVSQPIVVGGASYRITCVSMGNPHAVVFLDAIDSLDLEKIGPLFEHHPLFPERVNTEFVRHLNENTVEMRVWERGSGETMACGTGACATVVACVLNGLCAHDEEITVKLRGGNLRIRYNTDGTVIMNGTATKVFEGEVEL